MWSSAHELVNIQQQERKVVRGKERKEKHTESEDSQREELWDALKDVLRFDDRTGRDGTGQYLLLSLHLLPCDHFSLLDVDVIPLHLLQQRGFHEKLPQWREKKAKTHQLL